MTRPAVSLVLLALLLRLALLNPGFFDRDSILLVEALERSLRSGKLAPLMDGRYAYVAFHLPFYALFRALGLSLDVALNALTACLGALSVGLLHALAGALGGGALAAASAALLLALAPVYLSVTTHTMIHAFSLCAVLLAFLLLLQANATRSNLRYAAASLCLLVAISARFPNLLLLAPFALLYLEPRLWQRPSGREPGARSAGAGSAGGSWRSLAWVGLPLALGLALLLAVQWDAIAARSRYDPFLWLVWLPLERAGRGLGTQLGPVGGALLALGVLGIPWARRRARLLALLVWLVATACFYASFGSFVLRFLCIALPPALLLVGLALERVARSSPALAWLLLAAVAAQMLWTALPVLAPRHHFSGQKAYALWLRERTEPEALVIAMDEDVFVRHYAGRRTLKHPFVPPEGAPERLRAWVAGVRRALRQGTPVYLVGTGLAYDFDGAVRRALESELVLERVDAQPNEDYHEASLQRRVFLEPLYRLRVREG